MASAEKWVKRAAPGDDAIKVARGVIVKRLEVVWQCLEPAANKAKKDIEHIHQLRVATRRATAALRVFRRLARRKQHRALMRELRQLRQVAGAARDLDVLLERLEQIGGDYRDDAVAEAIAHIVQRRKQAQGPLIDLYREGKRLGWKRRVRKVARTKLWRKTKSPLRFGDVAHQVLTSVVDDFFAAAAADLSDVNALHRMRIRGKRLRYTMEVVCGAFDKTLRTKIYPEFEQVQERIGVVNDHATAASLFWEWFEEANGATYGEVFRELMVKEQERAEAARRQFLAWWTPQRADHLKQRFAQVLTASMHADSTAREHPRASEEPSPPAAPGEREGNVLAETRER